MACPLGSPLTISTWVCGGEACDISGDLCCGSAVVPRSKRSNEFQSMIQVIEAIIALGQQNLPRDQSSIIQAAMYLNPNESSITESMMILSLKNGRRMGLFTTLDQVQYTVNAHNAATRVQLFPYLAFIQEFNPYAVQYPPIPLN